jgi:hypothetical protein
MLYISYYCKSENECNLVSSSIELDNRYHSDNVKIYVFNSCNINCSGKYADFINLSEYGIFQDQFLESLKIIIKDSTLYDYFVFLGAGDTVTFPDEMINIDKKYVLRNRVLDSKLVNRALDNVLYILYGNKRSNYISDEFNKFGFLIGFIGFYTWPYSSLVSGINSVNKFSTIWFISELLDIVIANGFKIKPTYDIRVYKAAGDDQVVGSDSKEKLVKRFELCLDLIEIVGRTGIVSDVQLFKYKAKLLLRHRLVV